MIKINECVSRLKNKKDRLFSVIIFFLSYIGDPRDKKDEIVKTKIAIVCPLYDIVQRFIFEFGKITSLYTRAKLVNSK